MMGGGEIIRHFMRENLMDEYWICMMPHLLGEGIPLFRKNFPSRKIKLQKAKVVKGIVEMIYARDGSA